MHLVSRVDHYLALYPLYNKIIIDNNHERKQVTIMAKNNPDGLEIFLIEFYHEIHAS